MLRLVVELAVLVGLVGANALLAASELAVVSSRPARLRARADDGDAGAAAALELLESPNDFLSTVQVGITAVGILAGAWGGAALGESLGRGLGLWLPTGLAMVTGIAVAVVGVTYVTVVVGELVPKRLALAHPERWASRVAPGMQVLSTLARPLVILLSHSMERVMRHIPLERASESTVTEEEVRTILAEATAAGVLEHREHDIVQRLFNLSDRTASSLMTPRDRIVWLDLNLPGEEQLKSVGTMAHARFIVCDGALDRVRGYVSLPDLLGQVLTEGSPDVAAILRTPHFVRPWDTAFKVLEIFQRSRDHIALVMGTKGRVEGVVTLNDVLEGIVGDLPEPTPAPLPGAVRREDGSWLVDGLLPFEEFVLLVARVPEPHERFATLHAFVVERLGDDPKPSDAFVWQGVRLEVVDMDWNRVDKVLVQEVSSPPA